MTFTRIFNLDTKAIPGNKAHHWVHSFSLLCHLIAMHNVDYIKAIYCCLLTSMFWYKGTVSLKCLCGVKWWRTTGVGLGKWETDEVNTGGKQSLGGGIMTLQGHYADDMRVCVITVIPVLYNWQPLSNVHPLLALCCRDGQTLQYLKERTCVFVCFRPRSTNHVVTKLVLTVYLGTLL